MLFKVSWDSFLPDVLLYLLYIALLLKKGGQNGIVPATNSFIKKIPLFLFYSKNWYLHLALRQLLPQVKKEILILTLYIITNIS